MLTTKKRTGLRALASTASLQNHADGDHIDYQAVDAVVLGQAVLGDEPPRHHNHTVPEGGTHAPV